MDRDRKSTALKDLQGRIWEEGYRLGELVGEVVRRRAGAPSRAGARSGSTSGIFSSGSVLAQQLLFRHSSAGDLTALLRWYFDTTTGAKTDPESYRRIAAAMGDSGRERAVRIRRRARSWMRRATAGMQTRLCIRPGNRPPPPGHGHTEMHTFDDVA